MIEFPVYPWLNFFMFIQAFVITLLCIVSTTSHAVPLKGQKMMVATPSPLSAQIAEKIMEKNGNAVDVAVAIALTLSVTNPRHASLGGGGFAMVKMGKDPVRALDFREKAPKKFHPDFFRDKRKDASRLGPHAVGVPGIPAGLFALHRKYGKLHWSMLFDEPIKLASKGYRITGENADRLKKASKDFNPAGRKYFLKKDGTVPKPGDRVIQKQLAKALKLMRNRGVSPFYQGQIRDDIVGTLQRAGGVMTKKDFSDYSVRWLNPIEKTYKDHTLYLMPPPSSGGLIISASLSMLEKLETATHTPFSTLEFHHLAEVMKINFRNRNLLGDPDFVKNPIQEFTDAKKLSQWTKKIKDGKPLQIDPAGLSGPESNQTTHFSVLAANGDAVSMTITLNNIFGSKMVSDKYGIALNNEMDDFTTRPGESNLFQLTQGNNNRVQGGKRPLSSMSPTLIAKDGNIVTAIGAPGGPRIITGVLQSIYRLLTQSFNIEEAIHAPRVHHQFMPNTLFIDKNRLPVASIRALEDIGHKVQPSWHSIVNGVHRNSEGILEAAFDNRAEGGAGGY